MESNYYDDNPLYIAQVDPSTGLYVRAFYFLGLVPKTVLNAAQKARASRTDSRKPEWNATDSAVLQAFYGKNWKKLLTPEDPPAPELSGLSQAPSFFANRNQHTFIGGAEEEIYFNEIDDINDEKDYKPIKFNEHYTTSTEVHTIGIPIYTDIAVVPEDTIYDLKLKLSVASNVPFYRQHLFYYINEEGPVIPYRFTLDAAPVLIDWKAIIPTPRSTVIARIAVDPKYEVRREGIRIEALDTFNLVSPVKNLHITRAYFMDLFTVIPPLRSLERPNDGLSAILRDKYQFDILYYGGIIHYWPQLSPDACIMALSDPTKIIEMYPLLDPDINILRSRFELERNISTRAHKWRASSSKSARQLVAVTSATIRIIPKSIRMRVSIRNVFDWIPTAIAVSASCAKFNIDSSTLTESGISSDIMKNGGLVTVFASKRHVSSYGPRTAPSIDWFINKIPRQESVSYAIPREKNSEDGFYWSSSGRQVSYAYLSIFVDGHIDITANWREDDRVSFSDVTSEIAVIVDPIIDSINAMGVAAFPIGGELAYPADKSMLGAITISSFWPHAITSENFREIKKRFREYEKAGIVGIRGLQQAGAYTFNFYKGIVAYDLSLADRAEASARSADTQNQYAWLTDSTVASRWSVSFQGRQIRIYHRATDLRIEIIKADSLMEFENIRRYIFSFLDNLLIGPNKIRIGVESNKQEIVQYNSASHRLRKLQERDSNLFNLKKYNQSATVYSVLCQSGRQPQVYNESEIDTLSAKKQSSLVKYWNFTDNAPAYYDCPDKKYPHLSFRAGQHPLGYCLPCCKKTRAAVGSKAALVNENCLAKHAYNINDDSILSKHILTYGKIIAIGRISDLPSEISEGLFLDCIPLPYKMQLIGVEQSTPAIPNAGFAYALAYAIGIGDDSTDKVLCTLAETAASMKETYYALGNGGGVAFSSANDLSDAIINSFIRRDDNLSPFAPGGNASQWPYILADLARHVYGVEVITIVNQGEDKITIDVTPEAIAGIINGSARIAILAESEAGIYPVVVLNPKIYLQTPPNERWMIIRKTFGELDSPDAIIDTITETVKHMIIHNTKSTTSLDLDFINRWLLSTKYTIKSRLINLHNLCYGILVTVSNEIVYIPIIHSANIIDGTPIIFGPRPEVSLPLKALNIVISEINDFIKTHNEVYDQIAVCAVIVDSQNNAIGFTSGISNPLYFFHDAVINDTKGPIIKFHYDSREIDIEISRLSYISQLSYTQIESNANTRNKLYRLFLAEFSTILRAERNEKLRSQLFSILKNTKYDSAKSVSILRRRLTEILIDYPADLQVVRDAVSRAYIMEPQDPGNAAIMNIKSTSFNFDLQLMENLKLLKSHDEIVGRLKIIMGPKIMETSTDDNVISNMYVSCAEESTLPNPLCLDNRLLIPKNRINDFYDILAADIRNPSKTNILAAIAAGVLDPLTFIKKTGEHLSIKIIS